MKKETKELLRLFGWALVAMMAVPLAYRVCIHFWPPEEKPRQTLIQFFKEAESARCVKLLTKPISKWSDAEAKLEPEIYAWLMDQGSEILPWEWTEEARRKDPKGYAKCWRRIWDERKLHCEKIFAEQQKAIKRLEQELQILAAIHAHRTNQIARLYSFASTNAFPCQVSLEHIEKGRFWGWNKKVEMMECKDLAALTAATNSICSKEVAIAQDESKRALELAGSIASSKEKLAFYEELREICNKSNQLIEAEPMQDEILGKTLVENLKAGKKK